MMQDRKALQAGTSHYLGQNFAKASNIRFVTEAGAEEFAHTTSWGVSTRLVGGVIMTHGDDDGLRLPPRIAPKQVVIIPVIPKPENQQTVLEYAEKVKLALSEETFNDEKIEVFIDSRDMRGGDKNWQWVKKGVPVRIEVGPRDVSENKVVLYRRDKEPKEKSFMTLNEAKGSITDILNQIQANLQADARNLRETYTRTDITTFGELSEFFTPKNSEKPEIHGGFVLAHFHDSALVPEKLKQLKLTVRCKPLDQEESEGNCIVTGQKTNSRAIFAKAY
jgi:prolyl-tRNA synthetase